MARVDWVRNFYAKRYGWADWQRRWSDFDPSLRCYSPADLRLLEGTGLSVADVEPFTDEGGQPAL
jgi:hypothetical protein